MTIKYNEIRLCERCNQKYTAKHIKTRFCSKLCMYEWRKAINWELAQCLNCKCEFKRRKNEKHHRTGLPKQYCSNLCSLTSIEKKIKLKKWGESKKNHFRKNKVQSKVRQTKKERYGNENYNGSSQDGLSNFRNILNIVKNRAKHRKKKFDIELNDLVEQWKLQNGKCVYSGVQLELPVSKQKSNPLYTASLDRINSVDGYVKGNIQFISIASNLAKNKMTHIQMTEFCSIIKSN